MSYSFILQNFKCQSKLILLMRNFEQKANFEPIKLKNIVSTIPVIHNARIFHVAKGGGTRPSPNLRLTSFIFVYLRLPSFTFVYLRLPSFTFVYLRLPSFTFFEIFIKFFFY
jgi:hypothetical protein